MLRVWSTVGPVQRLQASMKEHQNTINCIALAPSAGQSLSGVQGGGGRRRGRGRGGVHEGAPEHNQLHCAGNQCRSEPLRGHPGGGGVGGGEKGRGGGGRGREGRGREGVHQGAPEHNQLRRAGIQCRSEPLLCSRGGVEGEGKGKAHQVRATAVEEGGEARTTVFSQKILMCMKNMELPAHNKSHTRTNCTELRKPRTHVILCDQVRGQ